MPKIPVYEPQVDPESGLPNVRASSAAFGGGDGLATIGAGLADASTTLFDVEQRQDISEQTKNLAVLRGQLTAGLDVRAAKMAPGDPNFVDDAMNDISNKINTMAANATTRAGQQAFQRGAAELTAQMLSKATSYSVASAGAKASADFQTTVNANSGTLFNDPSQFASIIKDTDAALSDPSSNFANIPADARAGLELHAKEAYSMAAVRGIINMNPQMALDMYHKGTLPGQTFLTEQDNYLIQNEATTKQMQLQAQAEKAQREAGQEDGNNILAAIHKNATNPDISSMIGGSRMTWQEKEEMYQIAKQATKSEAPTAVSAATSTDLFRRMNLPDGDPQKITDRNQINQAFISGKLKREDFDWVSRQFAEAQTPDGNNLLKTQSQFLQAFKPSIDKSNPLQGVMDLTGPQNFYRFTQYVQKQIAAYRQAGKDPYSLFDPSKPDYLGKPGLVGQYQSSIPESLNQVQQTLVGAGRGVSGVPQRKAGESPAQYLARTGGTPPPQKGAPVQYPSTGFGGL